MGGANKLQRIVWVSQDVISAVVRHRGHGRNFIFHLPTKWQHVSLRRCYQPTVHGVTSLIRSPQEQLPWEPPVSSRRNKHTIQAMYAKFNTIARSRNYRCRGKTIRITYSECVSVALVIQQANRVFSTRTISSFAVGLALQKNKQVQSTTVLLKM